MTVNGLEKTRGEKKKGNKEKDPSVMSTPKIWTKSRYSNV